MLSMFHFLSLVKFVNEKSRMCTALYVLYLDVISTRDYVVIFVHQPIVDRQ